MKLELQPCSSLVELGRPSTLVKCQLLLFINLSLYVFLFRYQLLLNVLQRPIKDHPLIVEVTEHNDPLIVYGSRGSGKDEFLQPVGVATDNNMVNFSRKIGLVLEYFVVLILCLFLISGVRSRYWEFPHKSFKHERLKFC